MRRRIILRGKTHQPQFLIDRGMTAQKDNPCIRHLFDPKAAKRLITLSVAERRANGDANGATPLLCLSRPGGCSKHDPTQQD